MHECPGDTAAVKSHDAFLRCAEAQQIDAAIPDNISIHDGIFLVDPFAADDFDLEFTEHAERYISCLTGRCRQ